MNNQNLRQQMDYYNPKGVILISKIIFTTILLTIFFNIILRIILDVNITSMKIEKTYIVLYSILMVLVIVAYFIAKAKQGLSIRFTYVFIISLFLISSIITIFDQSFYAHQLFYTIVIILCAMLILLPKNHMMYITTSSLFLHFIFMLVAFPYNDYFILQLVHLITLTILANGIAIGKMNLYTELMEQNKQAKHLTDELQKMNTYLQHVAHMDPLVNMPNRLAFNNYCENLQYEQQYGFVIIDIDCFKQYNDCYGHLKGDEVLQYVGQLIYTTSTQYGGYAARWGGEEFIVIFEQVTQRDVAQCCESIQKQLTEAHLEHQQSDVCSYVTISLGAYVTSIANKEQLEKAIQQADIALYNAKNAGRNKVVVH